MIYYDIFVINTWKPLYLNQDEHIVVKGQVNNRDRKHYVAINKVFAIRQNQRVLCKARGWTNLIVFSNLKTYTALKQAYFNQQKAGLHPHKCNVSAEHFIDALFNLSSNYWTGNVPSFGNELTISFVCRKW